MYRTVLRNGEFPMSVEVQRCGKIGLHTIQGASYAATLVYTSTRCLALDVMYSISLPIFAQY